MGFLTSLLGGGSSKQAAPLPVKPEKPISPVTNRATQEGIIRDERRRRASLATKSTRSLLNDETIPLGT